MECTYCGAYLEWEDSYGTLDYLRYGVVEGKRGDIYRCPNHEGFEDEDEAFDYAENNGVDYDDLGEVCCESMNHNVSGSFYTDINGNLYEGYPC